MKKFLFFALLISLISGLSLSCSNEHAKQRLYGRWKLSYIKISGNDGESWKTINPAQNEYGYEWFELGPDNEFQMSDPVMDYSRTVTGEWHFSNDSLHYLAPEISCLGGKCDAKVVHCDQSTLIIQQSDKDLIVRHYYIREQ